MLSDPHRPSLKSLGVRCVFILRRDRFEILRHLLEQIAEPDILVASVDRFRDLQFAIAHAIGTLAAASGLSRPCRPRIDHEDPRSRNRRAPDVIPQS